MHFVSNVTLGNYNITLLAIYTDNMMFTKII